MPGPDPEVAEGRGAGCAAWADEVRPQGQGHTGRVLKEPWRHRLLYVVGLVVAIGLIVFAFGRDSGREGTAASGGDAVEALIPADGSSVLAQQTIGVDLAPGYTGSLTINGQEVPSDELLDDRQSFRLLYQPTEDSAITLEAGENCATARIYEIARGPDRARLVTWCFDVT